MFSQGSPWTNLFIFFCGMQKILKKIYLNFFLQIFIQSLQVLKDTTPFRKWPAEMNTAREEFHKIFQKKTKTKK